MLSKEEIRNYLQTTGIQQEELFERARAIRDQYVGPYCFMRAVLEITNKCRINCDYCEMRNSNKSLERYILSKDEILRVASSIVEQQISTVFLQGGEIPQTTDLMINVIPQLKVKNLSVLLCLGNKSYEEYERMRKAGADGYILKLETTNPALHQSLRHDSFLNRVSALYTLRNLGYHVGTGVICGLPGQTLDSLVDDLYFIGQQRWSMCSVSPYIPPSDAHLIPSLSGRSPGSMDMTLNVIAVLRLLQPAAMIPTVSALELLGRDGQVKGLMAGANVITVNFTPSDYRSNYRIYTKDRFIVALDHVKQVVQAAKMSISSAPSLGPVIVPSDLLQRFFEEKWSGAQNPLEESVYTFKNPLLERIIKEISLDGPVCDLGCGDGRYTIPLLQKVKSYVHAVDFSESALERLKRRLSLLSPGKGRNLYPELANILNMHLHDEYNLIILANVIHYFSPLEVTYLLNVLNKHIKKGSGIYIGIETNIHMQYEPQKYFIFSNQYEHLPHEIKCLLVEIGFEIRKTLKTPIKIQVKLPPSLKHILNTTNDFYERQFTLYELYAIKRG